MMEISNAIQAILFYQAEPTTTKRLAGLLKREESEIKTALDQLDIQLSTTGLRLIRSGEEVVLGTAPEASALIDTITKEELSKDLSKASLETLSIILYKGPLTRAEIDYIRGVNSTFILRNLLVRGLIEKVENPNDQRSFLYKATFQLLEYMGVTRIEELPQYEETIAALNAFASGQETSSDGSATSAEDKGDKEDVTEQEGFGVSENVETYEEHIDENEFMGNDMLEEDLEADTIEEDEVGANFLDEELLNHHPETEDRPSL